MALPVGFMNFGCGGRRLALSDKADNTSAESASHKAPAENAVGRTYDLLKIKNKQLTLAAPGPDRETPWDAHAGSGNLIM
jgi:hypothetical protein